MNKKPEVLMPIEAVRRALESAKRKFTESFDVSITLNVKPSSPAIKGSIKLPHGRGRNTAKVIVFMTEEEKQLISKDIASQISHFECENLSQDIQQKKINIKRIKHSIATKQGFIQATKIARILGPRGLMPTISPNIANEVEAISHGKIFFTGGKDGLLQAGIGTISLSAEEILANLLALMSEVSSSIIDKLKTKPELVIGKIYLHTTQGKSVIVNKKKLLEASNELN